MFAEKDKGSLQGWVRGAISAIPIVVGYIPIGVAFGGLEDQESLWCRHRRHGGCGSGALFRVDLNVW